MQELLREQGWPTPAESSNLRTKNNGKTAPKLFSD
jgi:hypothetical protein